MSVRRYTSHHRFLITIDYAPDVTSLLFLSTITALEQDSVAVRETAAAENSKVKSDFPTLLSLVRTSSLGYRSIIRWKILTLTLSHGPSSQISPMKTILTICLILSGSYIHAQTTRRVNNIPGFNAQFTTIADALAASSDGDIITVDGSPFPYDPSTNILVIAKKVTITGPGYFLDQNAGVQSGRDPANINSVLQYDPGSEGSVLQGVTNGRSIYVLVSNITISHNRLVNIYLQNTTPCNNLIIHGNDFSLNTTN